jgi:DNA-binding MarR family transcriptional regulator
MGDAAQDVTGDTQTHEMANRLLRLMPRLQQWAYSTVQGNRAAQDLSLRQLAVLYRIRDGTVYPGELARRLRISPAVVTGLLNRLEQRGYLQRLIDPTDRRRLCLALTDSGLATSLAVESILTRDFAAQLVPATASERTALEQALGLLEQVVTVLERDTPRPGSDAIDLESDCDTRLSPALKFTPFGSDDEGGNTSSCGGIAEREDCA